MWDKTQVFFSLALAQFLFLLFTFSPAFAGAVIIDGTDASDHGSAGATNVNGWLYMQKVLENLAANTPPGNVKVLVDIGTEPGSTARAAIDSAFALSSLPAAGWTITHVNGDAAVTAWLNAISGANTGILALPTYGLTGGDMDTAEMAAVNARAAQIANFVNTQGGALHAMAEDGAGAWGWLTTLIPGVVPVDVGGGGISTDITLTPQGNTAFPGLTNANLAGADPWHTYFTGTFGGLSVLGTAPDGGAVRNLILGGGIGTVLGEGPKFPSDQKPGSILVYPYYTSNAQTKADTRITLTNIAGTLNPLPGNLPPALAGGTIYVHIFFLNGANCTQADMYVCLTKGASITFNTSTQDPDITGYIIAVAVNEMGRPVSWNSLVGNAFVSTPEVSGNYGAEAFAALPTMGTQTEAGTGDTAVLNLNGAVYDRGADQFAVEVQSPASASGQTIVHASVAGNISAGGTSSVSQLNTGLVVRGDEKQGSFVGFLSGGCLSTGSIRLDRPRVPTGMAAFVPAGQIATLVYNTNISSVGVLLTPKANAWSGIRTLHKTRTKDSMLTIPVFMPVC